MKVLIVTQGWYGERIAQHILKHKPDDWVIEVVKMTGTLPLVIDEPENYIPSDIKDCQLLITLSESPGMSSLIPDLARASGAQAVIAPIDNSKWLPPGLKNSILGSLSDKKIAVAFPKPFCTLEANTGNEFIDEFASRFGSPELNISLEEGRVKKVKLLRGSPCGSSAHVAEKLLGLNEEDAELQAGLLLHSYPCLASMEIDQDYRDALMHVSGYTIKDSVRRALRKQSASKDNSS